MRKLKIGLLLLLTLSLPVSIWAVDMVPGGAIWELTNPADGGTGYTAATIGYLDAADMQLTGMESGGYTGPDESIRLRITGNAWPANQTSLIEDVYVQFAISTLPYSNLYVDTLSFDLSSMSINSMKAEIYYSTSADFSSQTMLDFSTGNSNNYITRDELTNFNIVVEDMVADGETIYIRFYPWVDNDPDVRTGKYICLKNVEVKGKVESLEAPATATWYPSGSATPAAVGNIIADDPVYGDSLQFQADTAVLASSEVGVDLTCATIKTISGDWSAQADTLKEKYVQFSVSPKAGGALHADSLVISIAGYSNGYLKADIYYSTNPDFSASTTLTSGLDIPENLIFPHKFLLDTNIATGEKIYFRIYPYTTAAVVWPAMLAITDASLYGTTIGITADPPTVETGDLSYLSTTFVTSGGSIPTDGGSIVTERGVCWNTSGGATISDSKTSDGSGSGSFTSAVTGLTANTTYYLRAYATNLAGTSYGDEITFSTLAAIEVPTVTTSAVSNILVVTTEGGGEVTSWGGDSVTMRGVCWNTTGSPTLADNFTENGKGIGSFVSTMHPLEQTTTYYVRAYATNSAGTGYGDDVSFTTLAPQPDVEVVVAKDGSGDYTTVQAAFDGVPDFYTGNYTITVKPGTYKEKLLLEANKVNVTLRGEHPDEVILTYDDNASSAGGTSASYSCAIEPDDFKAYYITFENTNTNAQAVALRTRGDRQAFYYCRIKGYQDTYYSYGLGRTYMRHCSIEGAVDYIFGKATVYFDECDLHVLRDGAPITAASTDANSTFGYVFDSCIINTAETGYDGNAINGIYLGRPWQGRPRVAFINCYEPATVRAQGWTSMSPGLNPVFAEYKCFGPGFQPDYRSTNTDYKGIQLTDEEAKLHTITNVLSKNTNPDFGIDWIPDTTTTKWDQTIDFGPLDTKTEGDADFDLSASASTGLDITYESSNPVVATIDGNTVTIVGAGETQITASQTGNYLYYPASAAQTLVVEAGSAVLSAKEELLKVFPNPANDVLHIQLTSNTATQVQVLNHAGQKIADFEVVDGSYSLSTSNYTAGVYFIKVNNTVQKFVINR